MSARPQALVKNLAAIAAKPTALRAQKIQSVWRSFAANGCAILIAQAIAVALTPGPSVFLIAISH